MHLAAVAAIDDHVLPAATRLRETAEAKSRHSAYASFCSRSRSKGAWLMGVPLSSVLDVSGGPGMRQRRHPGADTASGCGSGISLELRGDGRQRFQGVSAQRLPSSAFRPRTVLTG
ncbi:hypothetical protein [Nonomuraea rubra]|uniref:hypothetical protein n=1 Tax=Nonomuraea rubra TaxID=46180 RepID=UPI0033F8A181